MELRYQSGFWNHLSTEAIPGALPVGQNSPQRVEHGLYAEQLSGTSFLAPRHENLRSWTYRIRPSVCHRPFAPRVHLGLDSVREVGSAAPAQLRWSPLPRPDIEIDFLESLTTWAVCGKASEQRGCAVHLYAANLSMDQEYFYSADGEFLIVPQEGGLRLNTEFGALEVLPGWIGVIPRGIKFQVALIGDWARGYVCENYGAPLRLPHLGPIGSNGLASPRDFEAPVARFEERRGSFTVVGKLHDQLWSASIDHSPLNVVAWHGNYYPYRYDLSRFNTINTVSFDHPDPSIFTVLTSPSDTAGTANLDFVIFPPRWMVAEHSFRPPYFHRNYMSEFMGLVHGVYDAKLTGFLPGGSSLHNAMSGHGPDLDTFEKASSAELKPHYIDKTLAFMFESRYAFATTPTAALSPSLQKDYWECWANLPQKFQR